MIVLSRVAGAALLVLAVSLPFETEGASFSVGGIRFTSVELVLGIALAAGVAALAADPERRARVRAAVPRSWVVLLAGFAAAAFSSAVAAPAFEGTALRAAARTCAGLALVPVVGAAVSTRRDLARIGAAVVAGATVVALIGLAEIVRDDTFAWLRHFGATPTYVGSIRRLSGPFPHANVAAMFLEAAVPLLAALVWTTWRRRGTVLAAIGVLLLVVLLEALVLTYSRAGLTGLLVSNLVVGGLLLVRRSRPLPQAAVPTLAIAALALAVLSSNLAASPTVRLALRHESVQRQQERLRVEEGIVSNKPAVVPRDELWRAAFELFRERPLLGNGLDTFRLSYGPELGLERWDVQTHSNSLYVETLVSVGAVGAVVFFGWLLVLAADIVRALVRSVDVWQAAVATALVAYLVHGVLDYFLLFSSTGLLFWLLCGLWVVVRRAVP